MNIIINNGKEIKIESYWKNKKMSKKIDDKGIPFPFPKHGDQWTGQLQFSERFHIVNNILLPNFFKSLSTKKDCLICDKKEITSGRFKYKNIVWEDGLFHYVSVHNIKPSEEFIDFIYKIDINEIGKNTVNISGEIHNIDNKKYVKLDRNQIFILDALMNHGGYIKKYVDKKQKNIYRYSEHAGLLDFKKNSLDKIIVSGNTTRVDRADEEIYLPKNMNDYLDFEYIFHTHPPTPKPGGRIKDGILFEFPSIGDIIHFIDHYNDGKTIGSLVIAPEGMYNIRKATFDDTQIIINEDDLLRQYLDIMKYEQRRAIADVGEKFTVNKFYSKITQDMSFINSINKILNKYQLHIDYYPRVKDDQGNWVIDTVYLPIDTDN